MPSVCCGVPKEGPDGPRLYRPSCDARQWANVMARRLLALLATLIAAQPYLSWALQGISPGRQIHCTDEVCQCQAARHCPSRKSAAGGYAIRLLHSRDGGQQWSQPRDLAYTQGGSDHPLLLARGGSGLLSWFTEREGYRLLPL